MELFAVSFSLLFFMMISFYCFGTTVTELLHLEHSFTFDTASGAFVFFSLFSFIYLPCVFFRNNLNTLGLVWGIIWILILILCVSFLLKGKKYRFSFSRINREDTFNVILLMLAVASLVYYSCRSNYCGWDTAAYMKDIQRALEHGTMYQDWSPFRQDDGISLKYALCSYYMFLAILAHFFHLPVLLTAKVVGGGTCILLSSMIIYSIAGEYFTDIRTKASVTILWCLFNFFYISIYTSSTFLMERAYEGKGWCANVIIPYFILVFYRLYHQEKENQLWMCVLIGAIASNSISMSMIVIAPVMCTIMSGIILISRRDVLILRNWIICMIPFGIYFLAYFLNSKRLIILMS